MAGTASSKISYVVNGESYSTQDKSVDLKLMTSSNLLEEEEWVRIFPEQNIASITKTFSYTPTASVKTYMSKSSYFSMTSYSGKNSLVLPKLHELYGTGEAETYRYYNALAWTQDMAKQNEIVDKNFRIIRKDFIMELAEKYLAGYSGATQQSLFIFNGYAVPVLSIINQIIIEASNPKSNSYYGSSSANDSFSIVFDKSSLNKIWNETNGDKNNSQSKYNRLKSMDLAIRGMKTQGKLNVTNAVKNIITTQQASCVKIL